MKPRGQNGRFPPRDGGGRTDRPIRWVRSKNVLDRPMDTRGTFGEALRPVQEKEGEERHVSLPAPLCGGRSLAHNPGRNLHKPSEEFPRRIGRSRFARIASPTPECVEDVSFLFDKWSEREVCSQPSLARAKCISRSSPRRKEPWTLALQDNLRYNESKEAWSPSLPVPNHEACLKDAQHNTSPAERCGSHQEGHEGIVKFCTTQHEIRENSRRGRETLEEPRARGLVKATLVLIVYFN